MLTIIAISVVMVLLVKYQRDKIEAAFYYMKDKVVKLFGGK